MSSRYFVFGGIKNVALGTKHDQLGFSKKRKQLVNSGDKIPSPKIFCHWNNSAKSTENIKLSQY